MRSPTSKRAVPHTVSRRDYTGPIEPGVDTVTIRYNGDPMAMVQAIENGEVDLTQPQSTADVLAAAEQVEGVEILPAEDATFEHVDLSFDNNGPFDPASYDGDEDAALKVRQAFLKTLPRQEIVDRLIKPLNEDAEVRDSSTRHRTLRCMTISSPNRESRPTTRSTSTGRRSCWRRPRREADGTLPVRQYERQALPAVRTHQRIGGEGRIRRRGRRGRQLGHPPRRRDL